MLATGLAQAQVTAVDPQPEERRYTVEVIIFAYTSDVATAGEVFMPEPLLEGEFPDDVAGDTLLDEADAEDAQPVAPLPEVEFARLRADEFALGDVMEHLERIDIYRPLMHFGWTQVTIPDGPTRPIRLSSLARPAPGLDGTLQLYLSRFLHLVVDVEMEAERVDDPVAIDMNSPVRYRIQEDRIFRSGELRYFDHPKFGVIARITRVKEDAPAESTELLGYPTQ